jgi:hypothetical protein
MNKLEIELLFEVGDNVASHYGGYEGVIAAWFYDHCGIHYDVDCGDEGSQTFFERDLYLIEKGGGK